MESIGHLHTCSNHLSGDLTIISAIDVTPTLSSASSPNPILSGVSTHPAQHTHLWLCCIVLILVLGSYLPTPHPIQHWWSYRCTITNSPLA